LKIATTRTVEAADHADVDALIDRLDTVPGAFLGCDVSIDGMFRREGWAMTDPPLQFVIIGSELLIRPRNGLGAALARHVPAQGSVLERLRGFLAHFPADPALGLYGAWAFDYCRLAGMGDPPAEGTRIAHLYFADQVLRWRENGTVERIRFAFDLVPLPFTVQPDEPGYPKPPPGDDFVPGQHAKLVARAVDKMKRGELISLVMSQSFRRPWSGDAGAAFRQLRRTNPNPAMFMVNFGGRERLFGSSPDIQARTENGWLETMPVCGTFRRGANPLEDAEQARGLMNSTTDESSLAVCSDSDRNDKAKVCEPGSIELLGRRRLMFLSTIVHTVDHLRGKLRAGVDGFDVLLAQTAPSTLVGTPKAAAVAAVTELEASPRHWYAGAVARIGTDGSCEANTILRFAWLRGDVAEVRTGGSLLPTSDPEYEEAESRLKTEALFRVLGFAPAATAPPPPPAPVAVRLADHGDPFPFALRDALGMAGATLGNEGITVMAGALREMPGPAVLLNEAALEAWDAPLLPVPENARALQARGEGAFAALGNFQAGIYARRRTDTLPAGWTALARAADGRVLAAHHAERRLVGLAFRPDSVLSGGHGAGVRALRFALDLLR